MVLGRESGHDVIPSQHFCVRMCIVYLCFQYTLRRFLVHEFSAAAVCEDLLHVALRARARDRHARIRAIS